MKARVGLVLAVLVTAVSLSTLFAKANHQNATDGNDVRGMLDIRKVQTFGRNKNPGWKIITFSRITAREMRDTGFLMVYLDTFDDSRFDYYALVSSNGSRVQGTLWRDPAGNKRDRRVGKLPAWRPNQRSVSLRVPLSKMNTGGKSRTVYRWFVKTLFTGDNCRRVCIDRAPNNALKENNGKPTPSPTDAGAPGLTESRGHETPTPDSTRSPEASPEASPGGSPSASPTP
ncbi:MAG: hypothetical protein ACRDJT_15325 [Actinomycetota bacterium]